MPRGSGIWNMTTALALWVSEITWRVLRPSPDLHITEIFIIITLDMTDHNPFLKEKKTHVEVRQKLEV